MTELRKYDIWEHLWNRLSYYDEEIWLATLVFAYVGAGVEAIHEINAIVLGDPGLWFALIPRDITRMVLHYIPNHHAGICDTYATVRETIDSPIIMMVRGHIVEPQTATYVIRRRSGGSLHSDTLPAIEMVERIVPHYRRILWYQHGKGDYSRGYCLRLSEIGGGAIKYGIAPYVAVNSSYHVDCLARRALPIEDRPPERSFEEWQDLWDRACRNDPYPL